MDYEDAFRRALSCLEKAQGETVRSSSYDLFRDVEQPLVMQGSWKAPQWRGQFFRFPYIIKGFGFEVKR